MRRVHAAAQAPAGPLQILPPTISQDLRIVWEVKNRFRLFRREADFRRHVGGVEPENHPRRRTADGDRDRRPRLGAGMLANLCVDPMGALMATCERDGARESYLAPTDHRVEMRLIGAAPQTTCAWVFDEGDGPAAQTTTARAARRCAFACLRQADDRHGRRRGAGRAAAARDHRDRGARSVDRGARQLGRGGRGQSGPAGRAVGRGLLLSPLRQRAASIIRPGRANFSGDRTCDSRAAAAGAEFAEWTRLGARWLSQACHRSLYGYQLRTALALAVENPHVAVTFLPLACTGATIENGVLGSQRARELNCTPDRRCPSTVPAQITQLQQYLAGARRARPDRTLDLVLLTVGANDIDFSGLVANVIIDATTERVLVGRGVIPSVEAPRARSTAQPAAAISRNCARR